MSMQPNISLIDFIHASQKSWYQAQIPETFDNAMYC